MKFYISASGIKRVIISSSTVEDGGGGGGGGGGSSIGKVMKWRKGSPRRIQHRLLLVIILIMGLISPFVFVRMAFIVLESTSCSSSLGCMRMRIFGGKDVLLREELTRALLEATERDGGSEIGGVKDSPFLPSTFKDIVKDVTSNGQDIKAFTFKTKAVISKLENMVQSARQREYINWHLAAHGIPKSLQCLSLMLAEEYAVNAVARSRLPPPEYASRLSDQSFNHVALLTDNVLAASVVISSAIKSSANPESMVFHVITDKKSYTAMHAWFAANNIGSAVVEVKGLHQYDWSHEINIGVKEMLEIHRLIWKHEYVKLKAEDSEYKQGFKKDLEVLCPSFVSLLNHLRIYMPELFPDLDKIVFLDDDVVVQHDLSPLWEMDMNGKVVGAVVDSDCGPGCCPGRRFKDYFNFTNTVISVQLDDDRCGWLYGMNIFDLQAWRKTNITKIYHHWLKLSLNSGFTLWHPGALPPALLAFEGHVLEIDPSWHLAGLGHHSPKVSRHTLESAAVIHFSGPAKPWLEIGAPKVRSLWYSHLNLSNEYINGCGIAG